MKKITVTIICISFVFVFFTIFIGCKSGKVRQLPLNFKVVNSCNVTLPDSVTVCVHFYDDKGNHVFDFNCCQKIKIRDTTRFVTETKFNDGDQWQLVSVEGLECFRHSCTPGDTLFCIRTANVIKPVSIDSSLQVKVGCECYR